MKTCPCCKETKPITEFGNNRSRSDGLQVQCRICKKKTQHAWYQRHKTTHYANVKQRRQEAGRELTRNLIAYFQDHPCVDCGENDPIVLEFDHVKGTKRFAISQRLTQGYSWEYLLQETEKCEVRCVKCHRRKTSKQFGYARTILLAP